eukprot:sb/3464862/
MTVFTNETAGIPRVVDYTIGTSLIIAMIASLSINPIVLFYHARKRPSAAKFLFVLLALSDFVTLFLTPTVTVISFFSPTPDTSREVDRSSEWYMQLLTWNNEITVQYSAFLTAVLSLTRCVSIYSPFYHIKMGTLKTCVLLWMVYLFLFRIIIKHLESGHFGYVFVWDPWAQMIVPDNSCPDIRTPSYKFIYVINATILQRGVWILVSLVSLILTLAGLNRRPGRRGRRSEVTIVVLTLAYLLAFIPMIVENVIWLSNSSLLNDNSYYLYYIMVSFPGQLLSAVNPVIIIIRSRELQKFLGKCFLGGGLRSGRWLLNMDFNTSQGGMKVHQLREMYIVTHKDQNPDVVVERFDGIPMVPVTIPPRQLTGNYRSTVKAPSTVQSPCTVQPHSTVHPPSPVQPPNTIQPPSKVIQTMPCGSENKHNEQNVIEDKM